MVYFHRTVAGHFPRSHGIISKNVYKHFLWEGRGCRLKSQNFPVGAPLLVKRKKKNCQRKSVSIGKTNMCRYPSKRVLKGKNPCQVNCIHLIIYTFIFNSVFYVNNINNTNLVIKAHRLFVYTYIIWFYRKFGTN